MATIIMLQELGPSIMVMLDMDMVMEEEVEDKQGSSSSIITWKRKHINSKDMARVI